MANFSEPVRSLRHAIVQESQSTKISSNSRFTCDVRFCFAKRVKRRGENTVSSDETRFITQFAPRHPHIVQYFTATKFYIFMEYLSLGSLQEYLPNNTSTVPVIAWGRQLCDALAYLHELGFAHSRLYPCHILVANGGNALKICNFDHVQPLNETTVAFDLLCFGLLLWFMQQEQQDVQEIPDNLFSSENFNHVDARASAFKYLETSTSLKLGDIMRMCWTMPCDSGSSAKVLKRINMEMEKDASAENGAIIPHFRDVSPQDFKDFKVASENSWEPVCECHSSKETPFLCVVKVPQWQMDSEHASENNKESRLSFDEEIAYLLQTKPQNPHIVHFLSVTDDYIFMSYYGGRSMREYIQPGVHPPVLDWTRQLCRGLVYIHDQGFCHNQLWPINVLVSSSGRDVVISDFGSVSLIEEAVSQSCVDPVAPELSCLIPSGGKISINQNGNKVDVYSLGILIWFMQHEGANPPDNMFWAEDEYGYTKLVDTCSHLELLDVTGLPLCDVMVQCWQYSDSRPTSQELLTRLETL